MPTAGMCRGRQVQGGNGNVDLVARVGISRAMPRVRIVWERGSGRGYRERASEGN